MKCVSKTHGLFGMSEHVLAVNQSIGDYAARFAKKVSIVPMAVTTGSLSTIGERAQNPHLQGSFRFWRRLQPAKYRAGCRAFTNCFRETRGTVLELLPDETMTLDGVDVDFVQWRYDREVALLQDCQIGIVPVKPSVWSPWKFFFKLIQYMSLGIPVVATATGSNVEIIEDGVNGFLANSEEEWYDRLVTLIDNPELRASMGQAARKTAEAHFSLTRQIDFIENVFRTAGEGVLAR